MSKKPAKIQFNGGVLSPWLKGRTDIAKYDQTAKVCRNFIPLTEGCLKRRGGTIFVAKTPEDVEYLFKIVAVPAEAKIVINSVEQDELWVCRGDTVCYEVSADGYAPVSGKVVVTNATTLRVVLTSATETASLEIIPVPSDATVKINGYVRTSYSGAKYEEVYYVVFKTGYVLQSGHVLLDEDKQITVTLVEDGGDGGDETYGAWGMPLAFISCSAYGDLFHQKKCFLLRFENGYLPILFDAAKCVPDDDDVDENLFVTTVENGYDALTITKNNGRSLAVIQRTSAAIFYNDLNGQHITGFDYASMMFYGWQLDEEGQYAAMYKTYDGVVSGKSIKVYYMGEQVWTMKGRKNG